MYKANDCPQEPFLGNGKKRDCQARIITEFRISADNLDTAWFRCIVGHLVGTGLSIAACMATLPTAGAFGLLCSLAVSLAGGYTSSVTEMIVVKTSVEMIKLSSNLGQERDLLAGIETDMEALHGFRTWVSLLLGAKVMFSWAGENVIGVACVDFIQTSTFFVVLDTLDFARMVHDLLRGKGSDVAKVLRQHAKKLEDEH